MRRTELDRQGGEAKLLEQMLEVHRDQLVRKVQGLTQEQMAVRIPPSDMTLAGLLKHLAMCEDGWFQTVVLGQEMPEPWASADTGDDEDWDFHSAVHDSPAELVALYEAACERSREAVRQVGDLDALSVGTTRLGDRRIHPNLRYVMVHMVEETAQHNGHADLLRETIDGVTDF